MAEYKMANVTTIDTPGTLIPAAAQGVPSRVVSDTMEAVVMSVSDVVRLARIPADAVISNLSIANDALTAGVVSVGVAYPPSLNGGATISAGAFATGVALGSATALTNRRFGVSDIATIKQPLWQLAGLSAKPNTGDLDIILTVTTANTAAGTISTHINYTQM